MHNLSAQHLIRALILHTNKNLYTHCLKGGSLMQQTMIMLRVSHTPNEPTALRTAAHPSQSGSGSAAHPSQ